MRIRMFAAAALFGVIASLVLAAGSSSPEATTGPSRNVWVQTEFEKAVGEGGATRPVGGAATKAAGPISSRPISGFCATTDGLYVATHNSYVWLTADHGATWKQLKEGLPRAFTWRLIQANDGTMVVGVGFRNDPEPKGVYYLEKGVWKQAAGLRKNGNHEGCPFTKDRHGNILVGYSWQGGIYRSTDNGRTFALLATLPSTPFSLVTGPDGTMYAGTEQDGIFQSTDDGATWKYMATTGCHAGHATAAEYAGDYDHGDIDTLIMNKKGELVATLRTAADSSVRRLDKESGKWMLGKGTGFLNSAGKTNLTVSEFAMDSGGTLYAAMHSGPPPYDYPRIAASSDNGATWAPFSEGLPTGARHGTLYLGVDLDGYLYASQTDVGLWRTKTPVAPPATQRAKATTRDAAK